jgi:predicted P-loop ATPase/GTPase
MQDSDANEKTEQQYAYEREQIERIFPNAQFTVAIDVGELDEVITDLSNIVIKNAYSCYCYDNCERSTDYFYIITTNGEQMTNKFIIQELIKQGLRLECNHQFIEGFYKSKNSDCQFEIWIGS